MFKRLACRLRRHEPVRGRTVLIGLQQVSECRHCRRPIARIGSGAWRPLSGRSGE